MRQMYPYDWRTQRMTISQENAAPIPRIAGISWSSDGYEVAILGAPETARFRPDAVPEMFAYLQKIGQAEELYCVIDTTNSLLAERALAVGLRVMRLDPDYAPAEYRGRGVPAVRLAELGGQHRNELHIVGPEGFLGSRFGPDTWAPIPMSFERSVSRQLAPNAETIYLSFDDGPSGYTVQILRILAKYNATASFFVVGLNVRAFPQVAAVITESGHVIGNHTWSHPYPHDMVPDGWLYQIEATQNAIQDATGRRSRYFRPPYGICSEATLSTLYSVGLHTVLWSHDSRDWTRPGAEEITRNAVGNLSPGSIILLHDGGGDRSQTVQALPAILDRARSLGLTATCLPRTPSR